MLEPNMVAARIQLRDCGATGAATMPARIADSSHGDFTSVWMLVRWKWILEHEPWDARMIRAEVHC